MNATFKRNTWYFILLAILATLITYSNHFDNAFHFDDFHTITENPHIRSLNNIPSFFTDGTTTSNLPQNQTYRPIVATSIAIDYWFDNSYNLFFFHLDNFLFFLTQGILLFFFFHKILITSSKSSYSFHISAVCALLYLLHPVMAETVNYVIARSDIQSTFFVILAFVLYQYSDFGKRYYLYSIPILIGTLAKPTALMFAPLFFCYVLLFESTTENLSLVKKAKHAIQRALKKTVPILLFCVILFIFQRRMTPDTYTTAGGTVFNYLITQPYVLFHYFKSLFLPFSLSADTDLNPFESVWNYKFFIGVIFILGICYALFNCLKKKVHYPIAFGILWFFIALAPTSSVIPLAEVMNDHRMFFPYIGLILSVVYFCYLKLEAYKKNNWINYYTIISGTIVVLALCAFGTFQRNIVWDTEASLWKDVTVKSPKNGRGLMNYGVIQMGKGNYSEAEANFSKALKLTPNYHTLFINLAILHKATGNKKEAEKYFSTAITKGHKYYSPWYYYGQFLTQNSRPQEAIEKLSMSHKISPNHLGTRILLMQNYLSLENWDLLHQLAKSTLKIDPKNKEALKYLDDSIKKQSKFSKSESKTVFESSAIKYLNLSLDHYRKKKYHECIEAAQKALKINPKYAKAYNNICAAYIELKLYQKAANACKKALKIDASLTIARNNLKNAEVNL